MTKGMPVGVEMVILSAPFKEIQPVLQYVLNNMFNLPYFCVKLYIWGLWYIFKIMEFLIS